MWKIQQLSGLFIERPGARGTCGDSNGTKAPGLKYSPPLAWRAPSLPSQHLWLPHFTFSPISSFSPSYSLMVFLLIFLCARPDFHLPLRTQLVSQQETKSILFSPLTLSFHAYFVQIWTPSSPWGTLTGTMVNYSPFKEDTWVIWGILGCFIITSNLITPQ